VTASSLATVAVRPGRPMAHTTVLPVVAWALYLFAFSLPLEAPDRFAFEISTMTGTLFVLTTLLDPRPSYARMPWPVAWYTLFLFVTLIAFVLEGETYPGGLYLEEELIQASRLFTWILLFWASTNLLREPRLYRAAFWALILGCLVRAALPLLGLARSTSIKGVERVAALGQNPNQSAQVLAMGLLALIGLTYFQLRDRRRLRVLSWAGVALIAIGIVQTGSRGGLVTAVIGAFIFLGTGRTLRARLKHLFVGAILLGSLGFLALRTEAMRSRLENVVESRRLSGREIIWPTALGMVRDRPLLGWGPVTNKRELAARLSDMQHESRDTHNLLLEILTASGILGLLPFLLGTWLCLRGAWHARAGPRGVLPLALVLAMLAGNMSQNRLTWPVFWFILSLGLASEDAVEGPPIPPARTNVARSPSLSPAPSPDAGGARC
jgi:O-antigen ligase